MPTLTILFYVLAAISKAVADTLDNHFYDSIFSKKDPKFWNPEISWKYVGYLRFTKYHPDAWHLSQSLATIFFTLAIVFYHRTLAWYYEVPIAGAGFILVFNLFFNKLLKR